MIDYVLFHIRSAPVHVVVIYIIGINVLTYMLYYYDKRAAIQKTWRIKESSLHVCMLLGGTLGAWTAQRRLRHKTRKRAFQRVFYVLLVIQLLGILLIIIE